MGLLTASDCRSDNSITKFLSDKNFSGATISFLKQSLVAFFCIFIFVFHEGRIFFFGVWKSFFKSLLWAHLPKIADLGNECQFSNPIPSLNKCHCYQVVLCFGVDYIYNAISFLVWRYFSIIAVLLLSKDSGKNWLFRILVALIDVICEVKILARQITLN